MGLAVGTFVVARWLAAGYAYSMRNCRLNRIDGGYGIRGRSVIWLVLGR